MEFIPGMQGRFTILKTVHYINVIKNESLTGISLDVETAFNRPNNFW